MKKKRIYDAPLWIWCIKSPPGRYSIMKHTRVSVWNVVITRTIKGCDSFNAIDRISLSFITLSISLLTTRNSFFWSFTAYTPLRIFVSASKILPKLPFPIVARKLKSARVRLIIFFEVSRSRASFGSTSEGLISEVPPSDDGDSRSFSKSPSLGSTPRAISSICLATCIEKALTLVPGFSAQKGQLPQTAAPVCFSAFLVSSSSWPRVNTGACFHLACSW